MLLRQDRFHIHPILCAKIVQGERKRKELVHFLFPSRSLYYQKIVQGERKTEQIEPQPILSHIRNSRKIKNFSKRYYSLRSGTTTSSTTASGFGCDTSFFGLSRWSGNVYATDKLTFNDCRARHSPGYSTAANWANP